MPKKPDIPGKSSDLRRRAETRLSERRGEQHAEASTQRLLHELEVHQIELELQNAELQKARDELERVLRNYTDLYDFAPVGYLSVDESGVILEANLTGASLLGVSRSRLINRRLLPFVSPASRPTVQAFLKEVVAGPDSSTVEAQLLKEGGEVFWAGLLATTAVSPEGTGKWCRVAFADITARKQVEEARRRLETLTDANRALNEEIAKRQEVEKALKESERHQRLLLKQAQAAHEQLQHLSRQVLHAQEEERKRISRELHDEIAQMLVGINVQLAATTRKKTDNPRALREQLARMRQLVTRSIDSVHEFARELRPPALDDLGLIPALHAHMTEFARLTGIRIHFVTWTSTKIRELDSVTRIVLYRVAQEALTNVARHAQASAVHVTFKKHLKAISLTIKDNGKAFHAQRAKHSKRSTGLGLIGMRERLEMVGGSLSVESAPGKGTTIRAQVPIDKASREMDRR